MATDVPRKRIDCGSNAVDRISSLPGNLIDLILGRLPMHDAARTTVLSKTWRNIWGMHPHLVFDKVFFSRMVSKIDKQAQLSEVTRTISNILLLHTSPLLKIHLSIPRNLPLHQCLDTDLWIKHISNTSGIRILLLVNEQLIAYKVPSYLFTCLELTYLRLENCILNPPIRFSGFPNLVCGKLVNVGFTSDMSFGTQLQALELRHCTGIEHLGCQFEYNNNLSVLVIQVRGDIDWRWFECTKKDAYLVLILMGYSSSRKTIINLDKLLDNMPRLNKLFLDDFFLKCSEPGTSVLERPITPMGRLTFLHLSGFGLHDFVQIQYVHCLLRSSPKLKVLHIFLDHKAKTRDRTESSAASRVEQYLQLPNFVNMILDQLAIVAMTGMVGSRYELQFIKLLLASSPSLRSMKLSKSITMDDPEEELRILGEVTRLPRASPTAQIIWT